MKWILRKIMEACERADKGIEGQQQKVSGSGTLYDRASQTLHA